MVLFWFVTTPSYVTVMVDNANSSEAHVVVGDSEPFDVPPMGRVFVHLNYPAPRVPIRVKSSDGYEEEVVLIPNQMDLNAENAAWIYDIGGSNQYRRLDVTYRR